MARTRSLVIPPVLLLVLLIIQRVFNVMNIWVIWIAVALLIASVILGCLRLYERSQIEYELGRSGLRWYDWLASIGAVLLSLILAVSILGYPRHSGSSNINWPDHPSLPSVIPNAPKVEPTPTPTPTTPLPVVPAPPTSTPAPVPPESARAKQLFDQAGCQYMFFDTDNMGGKSFECYTSITNYMTFMVWPSHNELNQHLNAVLSRLARADNHPGTPAYVLVGPDFLVYCWSDLGSPKQLQTFAAANPELGAHEIIRSNYHYAPRFLRTPAYTP